MRKMNGHFRQACQRKTHREDVISVNLKNVRKVDVSIQELECSSQKE
jgi:hypothetical protein